MKYSINEIYSLNTDLRTSNLNIIFADAATAILEYYKNHTSYDKEEIFISFFKFISKTLEETMEINDQLIYEISYRLAKQLSVALNIKWDLCINAFSKNKIKINKISNKKHLEAVYTIISKLDINLDFDIPYLAGYSIILPRKIYIDRGIRDNQQVTKNMIYSLAIHEFLEQALINKLKGMPYLYFRTHQIAQRAEKDVVKSFGYSWRNYQNKIMANEIIRAYNTPPKKTPQDLDYTPYIDCKDYDLIGKMKLTSGPLSYV